MSKLDVTPWISWKKELLVAAVWTVVLTVALFVLFAMLGGIHGRGGTLLTIVTAPIGLLHWMGMGDGAFAAIVALIAQVGSMFFFILLVRAVWRRGG